MVGSGVVWCGSTSVKDLCFFAMHQLCKMGYTRLVMGAVQVMLDVLQR
jgi:hypothetical protein